MAFKQLPAGASPPSLRPVRSHERSGCTNIPPFRAPGLLLIVCARCEHALGRSLRMAGFRCRQPLAGRPYPARWIPCADPVFVVARKNQQVTAADFSSCDHNFYLCRPRCRHLRNPLSARVHRFTGLMPECPECLHAVRRGPVPARSLLSRAKRAWPRWLGRSQLDLKQPSVACFGCLKLDRFLRRYLGRVSAVGSSFERRRSLPARTFPS